MALVYELTADGKWVYVTYAAVSQNLPAPLQTAFDAWLTELERLERLELIVTGVVDDFRNAVAAEGHPAGSLSEFLVPLGVLRHVLAAIRYGLAVEMGYAGASGYQGGWQESEVYLRRLLIDLRLGQNRFAVTAGGTPRYAGRTVAVADVPDPFYAAPDGGAGHISYGI